MRQTTSMLLPLIAMAAVTAPASAGTPVEPLTTARIADGFVNPICIVAPPDDYTRLFVVEKRGLIRIVNLKTGLVTAAPFLDIDALVGGGTTLGTETGLLGLAFDPEYADNGHFYVNFTDNALDTVVRRYTRATPDAADPRSGADIITIDQPQPNHNGGWMAFGPRDGYLYIATGDGGGSNDTGPGHTPGIGNAMDITDNLLGKLLRLDVATLPYAIPPDNPFIDIEGDDEIWSYGLRNPWRNSFDPVLGHLYVADVGQDAYEEVTIQKGDSLGGINYGWRCYEGLHQVVSPCQSDGPFAAPQLEYIHLPECAIVGGEVYRGCRIPTLDGTYFYADMCTSDIVSFRFDIEVIELTDRTAELDPPGPESLLLIGTFGRDALGEIYLAPHNAGAIYRIEAATPTISEADIDCSGAVNVDDLVRIIQTWGPCDGCIEDLTGDHAIGVDDLIEVIVNWG